MIFAIFDDFYGGFGPALPDQGGKKRSITGSIIWGKTISGREKKS